MSGPNDNGQPPPHMGSQPAPAGNHTNAAPSFEKQVLEIQRRERALQKERESFKGMVSMDDLKARGSKDRNAVLKELGFDDLIPKDDGPTATLQRQFEALQAQLAQEKQLKEEESYFNSVRSGLSEKPDDYELIHNLGAHDQLFDAIRGSRGPDGEHPDHFELANQMESNLLETLKKVLPSKKLQPFLQELMKTLNPQPQGTKPSHPLDSSRTLNANDRPSGANQSPARAETSQEAIERVSKLLKFNSQG